MTEFRIYHVARNTAKHNYELDDFLYGSPYPKEEKDWALVRPLLYIQRLKDELSKVETAIDDLSYLMREKGWKGNLPEKKEPTIEEADAYAFHKFHVRQFEYVEKLSNMLERRAPEDIDLNIPKARRQLNILLAARDDLMVTIVRFSKYAEQLSAK